MPSDSAGGAGERCSFLSDSDLADQITTWSGRIAAGEARLLELIAEFDRREAWAGPGLLSCAHWLVWRTGLSPGAAREKVRVARALLELPQVAAALGAGRLSFSQARAVTRVATPDDQERWVDLCRHTTAAQLEKLVRGIARVRRAEQDAADPELARWRLRTTTTYDDDGNLRLVITVSPTDGALLTAALAQVQADLDRERIELLDVSAETPTARPATTSRNAAASGPDVAASATPPTAATTREAAAPPAHRDAAAAGREPSRAVRRSSLGEALVELARRSLDAATPERARRTGAQVTAQVDPLSGWARLADGELLPPSATSGVSGLRQALSGLPGRGGRPRLRPLTTADLTRLDLGRTSRLPNQALRDLLGAVDGERCRFPGCSRRRRLHAHHVRYWQAGGTTDLANLVLVCARHHTVVHSRGFVLALDPDDRSLTVRTADGRPVPHHPDQPWDDPHLLDPDHHVSAETVVPDRVEGRMDLRYCVAVLLQQAA